MEKPFVRDASPAEIEALWDQHIIMVGTFDHFKECEAAFRMAAAEARLRSNMNNKTLFLDLHVRHVYSGPYLVSTTAFGGWVRSLRLAHKELRGEDAFQILADRAKALNLKKSLQYPSYLRALEEGRHLPTTWPSFKGIATLLGTLPRLVAHMSVMNIEEQEERGILRKGGDSHAS